MARTPIQQQQSVGTSSPRARAVDTFVQSRPDNQAAQRADQLASVLGLGVQFAGDLNEQRQQEELQEAERHIELGIVEGMINDGTEIRQGTLEFADSPYFRRGVEIGRSRAAGLEIGLRLDQRRQQALLNGETIPTDPEGYMEWRSENEAAIQEEMGLDPDLMSPAARREYAAALNQIRQQDGQRQRAYANQQLEAEAYEQFNQEVMASIHGAEDLEAGLEAIRDSVSSFRARGLDGTRLKREAALGVIAEANRTNNPQLLSEYMENDDLLNNQLRDQLITERRQIVSRVQQEEAARIRRAEKAHEEQQEALVQEYMAVLVQDPYQPVPESIRNADPDTYRDAVTLQQAFINNENNSVNPAVFAGIEDNILRTARSGQASLARREVIAAVRQGLVPTDQIEGLFNSIRGYEENSGILSRRAITNARSTLTMDAGIQGLSTDATRIESDRLMQFDTVMIDEITRYRAENHGQEPSERWLQQTARDIANEILDVSQVPFTGVIDNATETRSAIRGVRQQTPQENSDNNSEGDGPPTMTRPQ